MRKLFIVLLVFISSLCYSQDKTKETTLRIGAGVSAFNIPSASSMGINLNLMFNKIYFDLSTKYATTSDKTEAHAADIGYSFPIAKKFAIIPTIGYGWYTQTTISDGNSFDETHDRFKIGAIGRININKYLDVYAGIGSFETFKAGLMFKLF